MGRIEGTRRKVIIYAVIGVLIALAIIVVVEFIF